MAVLKYRNENGEYVAIPTGIPNCVSAFENDADYQNAEQVGEAITNELADYYNKSEVDQQYALKTEIPDTTGFITMPEVEEKGYQTEEQVNALIEASGGSSSGIDTDLLNYIMKFRQSIENPISNSTYNNATTVNASACNVTDGGKFKDCIGSYMGFSNIDTHKYLFWDMDDAWIGQFATVNESTSNNNAIAKNTQDAYILFKKNHTYKVHYINVDPLKAIINTYGKEVYLQYKDAIWGQIVNAHYYRGEFGSSKQLFYYDYNTGIYAVEEIHRPEDIIDAKLAESGGGGVEQSYVDEMDRLPGRWAPQYRCIKTGDTVNGATFDGQLSLLSMRASSKEEALKYLSLGFPIRNENASWGSSYYYDITPDDLASIGLSWGSQLYNGNKYALSGTQTLRYYDRIYFPSNGEVHMVTKGSYYYIPKYLNRFWYDNTVSGLNATDIPAAIDELKGMIDTLNAIGVAEQGVY